MASAQERDAQRRTLSAAFAVREAMDVRCAAVLVDHEGYAKDDATRRGGYGWNARTTRIAFMVHKHLQHQIEAAITQAMGDANARIAEGIQGAVNQALKEIRARLSVELEKKR